uniref:HOOK_N domain-containing protein n=1 Tax=Rhabditophanes sp. KR3021 TaxID=114890 RepID=A0AC35UB45_9BILA
MINLGDDMLIVSLQQWMVQVAGSKYAQTTPEDLFDGRLIVSVLRILDRTFFDEEFDDAVYEGKPDKSVLFLRICTKLAEYYEVIMHRDLYNSPTWNVNAAKIGRLLDVNELTKLLLLILAAATSNPKANELLKEFSPSHNVRDDLSKALSDIDGRIPRRRQSLRNEEFEASQVELNRSEVLTIVTENHKLKSRLAEMERTIILMQEKNAKLCDEAESSKGKIEDMINVSIESDKLTQKLKSYQDEMKRVFNDMEKLEMENSKLIRERKAINDALNEQNAQTKAVSSEMRTLKDNYESLQSKHYQLERERGEANNLREKYKNAEPSNCSELNFLKQKLNHYVGEISDNEIQKQKNSNLKVQLSTLKSQIEKSEDLLERETDRCNKIYLELLEEREKVQELGEQLSILKEVNQKLQESKCQSDKTIEEFDAEFNLSVLSERRESVHMQDELLSSVTDENAELKKKLAKAENDVKSTECLSRELENEKMKCDALKERLKVAEKGLEDVGTSTDRQLVNANIQNEEKNLTIQSLEDKLSKMEKQADERTSKILDLESTCDELSKVKTSTHARFEKGISDARHVIEMYESFMSTIISQDGESFRDIEALRNKIKCYERNIQYLEKKQKQMQALVEQEQRLITGNYYEMCFNLSRQLTKDDIRTFMDKQIKRIAFIDAGER